MSSGSDSDEDYVPGKPEQLSEEESADEETEAQYEAEIVHNNKRKSSETQLNGKRRKIKKVENIGSDEETAHKHEGHSPLDPEDEKKKEDALWASFLGDTPKPTPKVTTQERVKDPPKNNVGKETKKPATNKETVNESKDREARIFEFAGEQVIVENNVIKEVVKATPSTSPLASANVPVRRSGGLGGLVSQLNKKNKLSTLEKTKLDWDTFKKKEGIEEELQSHNKGKEGYLEKQDFLERADHRQFELERELRTGRRSDR